MLPRPTNPNARKRGLSPIIVRPSPPAFSLGLTDGACLLRGKSSDDPKDLRCPEFNDPPLPYKQTDGNTGDR